MWYAQYEFLARALELMSDPATLKVAAVAAMLLFGGLVMFAVIQYQTSERRWGMKLVLGLLGGALVVGLGTTACNWVTGTLYGVGYLLTWVVWVLTRRWDWRRQAWMRGLSAGLALGPWLWFGATEKALVEAPGGASCWDLAPGLRWFWMLLGGAWLLALVGGWGCWQWPLVRPERRRRLVTTWAVLGVLGLNWYVAGRVNLLSLFDGFGGQPEMLCYVLVSRPGSQWYRDQKGTTPLHGAIENGDAGAVRLLLAVGASAKAEIQYGVTPLHLAAFKNQAAIVGMLLDAGADVNAVHHGLGTPLCNAVSSGDVAALRVLLAAGATTGTGTAYCKPPLHEAAYRDLPDTVRLLLDAGAQVNARDGSDMTPLDVAEHDWYRKSAPAAKRENHCRELLRQAGGKTSNELDGGTPLHAAAAAGALDEIRGLLAAGADPNAKLPRGSCAGWTPLHWAAVRDSVEAVRLLLDAGARVNERDDAYQTALDRAAWACREPLRQAGGKTGRELDAE